MTALHPCESGYLGDAQRTCSCTTAQVQRYRSRVSGPLLDRIDVQVEVRAVSYRELAAQAPGENSAIVRARVGTASASARASRGGASSAMLNMTARDLARYCVVERAAERLLEQDIDRLALTARHLYSDTQGRPHHR